LKVNNIKNNFFFQFTPHKKKSGNETDE